MSLSGKRNSFKISIEVYVYAPYDYTSRLMIKIVNFIKRIVGKTKLVDIKYSFTDRLLI